MKYIAEWIEDENYPDKITAIPFWTFKEAEKAAKAASKKALVAYVVDMDRTGHIAYAMGGFDHADGEPIK